MKKLSIALAAWILSCSVSSFAVAGVIDTANVGTKTAFIDTTTGLTCLDLDNFWTATATYNTVKASLVGSGFHIATVSDMAALEASMLAPAATFVADAIIVGANYAGKPGYGDRNLMWGIYEDGDANNNVGYAYNFGGNWNNAANAVGQNQSLLSSNSYSRDLGAWVVSDHVLAQTVPEPASLFLVGVAMMGMFGARLKRNRK